MVEDASWSQLNSVLEIFRVKNKNKLAQKIGPRTIVPSLRPVCQKWLPGAALSSGVRFGKECNFDTAGVVVLLVGWWGRPHPKSKKGSLATSVDWQER